MLAPATVTPTSTANQHGSIVLYGAVSKQPPANLASQARMRAHAIKDRIALALKQFQVLDYRNYQRDSTYNRGDVAIVDAIEAKILQKSFAQKTKRLNWGELSSQNVSFNDSILVCGSGYIHPTLAGLMPDRIYSDLKIFQRNDIQTHLLGIGYNRLLTWDQFGENIPKETIAAIKSIAEVCATRTARDVETARILQQISGVEFEVIGDPALFLATPEWTDTTRTSSRLVLGINLPFHGIEPTEWLRKNYSKTVKLFKAVKERLDCEVRYFVHYDSEIAIAGGLKDAGVVDRIVSGDTSQMMREYGNLDLHVGGMLHSCIMATAAHVPSIALAYDAKHFGFFELMNRQRYCVAAEPFDPDLLFELINELHRSLGEQRQLIMERRGQLEDRFDAVLDSILNRVAR